MKPKFKVGDIVKYCSKFTNIIYIGQIVEIINDFNYEIKIIFPTNSLCLNYIVHMDEYNNTFHFTAATLLTDEEKLELL
jgi:hypothetical protein